MFLIINSYLLAEYYETRADCLTKPVAKGMSTSLQTLQHVLCRVHGAILITGRKAEGNM